MWRLRTVSPPASMLKAPPSKRTLRTGAAKRTAGSASAAQR